MTFINCIQDARAYSECAVIINKIKLNKTIIEYLLKKQCPNVQLHKDKFLANPENIKKHILGPGSNSRTKECIDWMKKNEKRHNSALVYAAIHHTGGLPNTEIGRNKLMKRLFPSEK